ncbi:MAG: hypothetical protein JKY43_07955, partial [Phycisphaerales bacterium]|nr:hypothetical protein [Phycisphaerales bacterium]
KYENLNADEVHSIMRGESIARSTVADLLAATPPPSTTNGNDPDPKKAETPDTDTPPDTLPSPA